MYFQITECMSLDIVSKVISNNAVIAMQKYRGNVQLNKFKFKLFFVYCFLFSLKFSYIINLHYLTDILDYVSAVIGYFAFSSTLKLHWKVHVASVSVTTKLKSLSFCVCADSFPAFRYFAICYVSFDCLIWQNEVIPIRRWSRGRNKAMKNFQKRIHF